MYHFKNDLFIMASLYKYHPENVSTTYPGEYTPPQFDWDELMKELRKPREGNINPSANVRELADHYIVEIMAPGHTKNDFIVSVNNNQLSVVVMSAKSHGEEESYKVHEFNMDCFSQVIELPKNIDTDFIRAEYTAGILSICFPKINEPTLNLVHRIIIY
jgi:HSP20 family molecular chaperone IbpA